MSKIFGQLESAQLEVLASDPATRLVNGRVIYNSTSKVPKYYDSVAASWKLFSTTGSKYDAVVAATPITGFSTHTTIGAAITAVSADASILIMPGTYAENVSVSKRLFIEGAGYGSYINGTLTFTSGSIYSIMSNFRVATSITMNSGSNYNQVLGYILDAALSALVDNGTGNYLRGINTV